MKNKAKIIIIIFILLFGFLLCISHNDNTIFNQAILAIFKRENVNRRLSTNPKSVNTDEQIHFLKTYSGDAILLESNGKYALIDTGQNGGTNSDNPYYQSCDNLEGYLHDIPNLDFVILTHFHRDHVGCLSVLQNFAKTKTIGKIYYKDIIDETTNKNNGTLDFYDASTIKTNYYDNIFINLTESNLDSTAIANINSINKIKITKNIAFNFEDLYIHVYNPTQSKEFDSDKFDFFNNDRANTYKKYNNLTNNAQSLVVYVRDNNTNHDALLAGDIFEADGERRWLNIATSAVGYANHTEKNEENTDVKYIDIYKAAHHGAIGGGPSQCYYISEDSNPTKVDVSDQSINANCESETNLSYVYADYCSTSTRYRSCGNNPSNVLTTIRPRKIIITSPTNPENTTSSQGKFQNYLINGYKIDNSTTLYSWNTKTLETKDFYWPVYHSNVVCNLSTENESVPCTNYKYKISFDANGGSITTKSIYVENGSRYSSIFTGIDTPTKTGYSFAGWYTAANGGTQITNTTGEIINNNKTLYAHWTKNTYKITLDNENATTSGTTSIYETYNSKYSLTSSGTAMSTSENPIVIPKKEYTITYNTTSNTTGLGTGVTTNGGTTVYNYTFGGYYTTTDISGTQYISNNGYITNNASTTYFDANGILYAKWTKPSNTIFPTITKNGYTCGWTTNSTGKQIEYTSGASLPTITASTTYYSVCTSNSYILTANANGGSITSTPGWSGTGTTATKSVSYGTAYGTLPTASRSVAITYNDNSTSATLSDTSGTSTWSLNGWYTSASGGTAVSSSKTMGSTNTTIYAQWSKNSTTLATITKQGKKCSWNTKSDGSGTYFASGASTNSITNTTTLYAICNEAFDYTINNYEVDETNNYISKIKVNTSLSTFSSNIVLGNGYSMKADTTNVDGNYVLYTGGKTKIYNGNNIYRTFTNIVIGDINGDGAINSADLLRIRQHLLRTKLIEGFYFLASDINYDNEINSADLLRVRQHLLGTKPIG